MSLKEPPVCPHCNMPVKQIIEIRKEVYTLERVKEVYRLDGYTLEPDPEGELRFIGENQGTHFKCALCGGNLADHFGVMGLYQWIEKE